MDSVRKVACVICILLSHSLTHNFLHLEATPSGISKVANLIQGSLIIEDLV